MIHQFDLPAIKAVFQATEFIGLSSYPSLNAVFRESDLENALWQFARELKYFGVNLEQVRTARFVASSPEHATWCCLHHVRDYRQIDGCAETSDELFIRGLSRRAAAQEVCSIICARPVTAGLTVRQHRLACLASAV